MKHLKSPYYKIEHFSRYILNNSDNSKTINDGNATIPQEEDFVSEYELYINNSFDKISDFISSLFKENGISYEKLYEKILIKNNNKYFYLICLFLFFLLFIIIV
jgi:hypothetical protein